MAILSPLLHPIDFCLPPSYRSFMRFIAIRFGPHKFSQKRFIANLSSISSTNASHKEEKAIKSGRWGLKTGQACSSIYPLCTLDFAGAYIPRSGLT